MMSKYLLGIILILIGAGFLLDQFSIISFGDIFSLYWPSFLILIGISGLFDKKSSKTGNMIIIVLGGLLQLDRLDLIDVNIYKLFWPILLIIIGLKTIFSNDKIKTEFKSDSRKENMTKNITLEDRIDIFAIFSGIETNIQSKEFKGGKATAILGGIELDLRDAKFDNREILIEINAILGGVDIQVSPDWRVDVTGTPIFGGWSNKTKSNIDPNAPLLKIKCFAVFGGVEIK